MNSRKSARITLTLVLALVAGGSLLPAAAIEAPAPDEADSPQASLAAGERKTPKLPALSGIPGLEATPPNDDFADAEGLSALPARVSGSTIGATTEEDERQPCAPMQHTVWYRLEAGADTTIEANTFEADHDTVLAAYEGPMLEDLSRLDCNDDTAGLQSQIFFDVQAGRTYYLQVGGYDTEAGTFTLAVNADATTPGATISGTVTGEDGPLEGLCVTVYDEQGDWLDDEFFADPTGTYRIRRLPGGTYYLEFRECAEQRRYLAEWYDDAAGFDTATPVTVPENGHTPGIDAVLALGGTISGTIVDEEGDPAEVCAVAYDADAWSSEWAETDPATGAYTIQGLATSSHRVWAYDCWNPHEYMSQYWDGKPDWESADLVPVAAGEPTVGIDFVMDSGGSIAGTITEDGTGAPLADVCATAVQDGFHIAGTVSVSGGTYAINGLAPGSYKILFDDCGASVEYEYFDDVKFLSEATPVEVIDGQVTSGIDAGLRGVGQISGRVTRSDGTPLTNACIALFTPNGTQIRTTQQWNDSYTFWEVPVGDYKVRFQDCSPSGSSTEWWNDQPDLASADVINVARGQDVTGIDAVISGPGSISGTVRDAQGNPVASVCVYRYAPYPTLAGSTTTDSTGFFKLWSVPPGSYQLYFTPCGWTAPWSEFAPEFFDDARSAEDADPVVVADGAETSGIDVVLDRYGGISGNVPENGDPWSVCVDLQRPDGQQLQSSFADEEGDYVFNRVAQGEYLVRFRSCSTWGDSIPEWYDDHRDQASADPVAVAWDQVTAGVDATVSRANIRFSGTPSVAEGGDPTTYTVALMGRPDQNVTVAIEPNAELTASPEGLIFTPATWDVPQTVTVEAVDDFDTEGDHPGSIRHVMSGDPLWDGRVNHLSVSVSERWGRIEGRLTDQAGNPIANACATAFDEAGSQVGEASTGSDGRYAVGSLRDGSYRIRFGDCGAGKVVTEWFEDRPDLASADPLHVELDAVRTANATLEGLPGRIAGTIRDFEGATRSGICVDVFQGPGEPLYRAVTGSDGAFAIEGVAVGTYEVRYLDCGLEHLATRWHLGKKTQAEANAVRVGPGESVSLAAFMPFKGRIKGTIATRNGVKTGVCIDAYRAPGEVASTATTDASGAYVLFGLDDGSYRAHFRSCGERTLVPEWYQDVGTYNEATPISVVESQIVYGISAFLEGPSIVADLGEGWYDLVEGGDPTTLKVWLRTAPTNDVSVEIVYDDDLQVSANWLTFTPDDWDVAQTLTVGAFDDRTVEDRWETTWISLRAGGDPDYENVSWSNQFQVEDDDWRPRFAYDGDTEVIRGDILEGTFSLELGDGTPLAGYEVRISDQGTQFGGIVTTTTDENGRVSFAFETGGSYGRHPYGGHALEAQFFAPYHPIWGYDGYATLEVPYEVVWEHELRDGDRAVFLNTLTEELRFAAPGDDTGALTAHEMSWETLPTGDRVVHARYTATPDPQVILQAVPERGAFAAAVRTARGPYVLAGGPAERDGSSGRRRGRLGTCATRCG